MQRAGKGDPKISEASGTQRGQSGLASTLRRRICSWLGLFPWVLRGPCPLRHPAAPPIGLHCPHPCAPGVLRVTAGHVCVQSTQSGGVAGETDPHPHRTHICGVVRHEDRPLIPGLSAFTGHPMSLPSPHEDTALCLPWKGASSEPGPAGSLIWDVRPSEL